MRMIIEEFVNENDDLSAGIGSAGASQGSLIPSFICKGLVVTLLKKSVET